MSPITAQTMMVSITPRLDRNNVTAAYISIKVDDPFPHLKKSRQ
jgi:hypothetical protein